LGEAYSAAIKTRNGKSRYAAYFLDFVSLFGRKSLWAGPCRH